MKRYNLYLPDALIEKIQAIAENQGLRPAAWIRMILSKAVNMETAKRTKKGAKEDE